MTTKIPESPSRAEPPAQSPGITIDPLEIHPSIPADIASGLMEVARRILEKPESYDQAWPFLRMGANCLCCHLREVLNDDERSDSTYGFCADKFRPLTRLYNVSEWPFRMAMRLYDKNSKSDRAEIAAARIEYFLRTAE